jgi:hypothetical protein
MQGRATTLPASNGEQLSAISEAENQDPTAALKRWINDSKTSPRKFQNREISSG